MINLRVSLLLVLLPFAPQSRTVQSASNTGTSSTAVSVDIAAEEWLGEYLEWMHHHHGDTQRAHSAQSGASLTVPDKDSDADRQARSSTLTMLPGSQDSTSSAPQPVMLRMPYLELYSPSGISLYRGTNAEQNAAFLRELPHGMPTKSTTDSEELRPTFQEYMNMNPKLKPYFPRILAKKEATIFAVTFPDKPFCKAQNEAMQQFKSRANSINVRVIEVRLHP